MKSSELTSNVDFFFEMEARDEQQMIAEYEGKVLQEITYKVQGKTAISYNGIKFIANKLGGIKVLPESIKIEFIKEPEEMWVASVVVINEKYNVQMPGAGEQPHMMKSKGELVPDPFARRKALSKATRNATRAVIPEAMIIKFLDDIEKGHKNQTKNQKPQRRKTEATINPFDKKTQIAKALEQAKLDVMRLEISENNGALTITPDPDVGEALWKQYQAVFIRYGTWNEESWEVQV
jgi:hypothetical protein